MKRVAIVISTVTAAMMLSTLPAVSAEEPMGKTEQKNECLLYANKCADNVDSIQQKIMKLKEEIAKGTKTYSAEELQRLNDKLNEANKFLDQMTSY